MNSIQCLFTLVCAVLATSQATEDGDDVALQTTLEFDGTDEDSDSTFVSKMKDILKKIKIIMTSTRRQMITNKGNKKLNDFLKNAGNFIESLNKDDLNIMSNIIKREHQRRSHLEPKHRDRFEIPFRRTGRSRSKVRKTRPDRTTTREDHNNSEEPKDVGFHFKNMSDSIVNWFNNVFNPENVELKSEIDNDDEKISKKETKNKSKKRQRKHKGKQKQKVPEDKEERSDDKQMLQSLTGMIQSLLVDQFQSLKTQEKRDDHASSDAESSKDELGNLLQSYLKQVQAKDFNFEPTKKKSLPKRFKKISNCPKNVSGNRHKRKPKKRIQSNPKETSLNKTVSILGPSVSKNEKKLKNKKKEDRKSKTDKHKGIKDTDLAKLVKKAGSPTKALRKIQEIQEMLLKSINGTTDDQAKSTNLVLDKVVINVFKGKSNVFLHHGAEKKRKTLSIKHKKKSIDDNTSEDNSVQKVARLHFNRARSEEWPLFPVSDNEVVAEFTKRTRNETKSNGFTSNEANTNKVILVSKSTQDNDYVTEFSTDRVKVDHAKQSASTTTEVAAADVGNNRTGSDLSGKLDERVPLIQQSRATLKETDVY